MKEKQNPQVPQHRFDRAMECPLTYRERLEFEFGAHFIPYLKALEKTIGRDKVIESLQALAFDRVKEFAEQVVKGKGKNDLSVFKEIFSPANPGLWNTMAVEVLNEHGNSRRIREFLGDSEASDSLDRWSEE